MSVFSTFDGSFYQMFFQSNLLLKNFYYKNFIIKNMGLYFNKIKLFKREKKRY